MGEKRNPHNIMIGGPEWKRPLGRPTRRWEDTISVHFREIVWEVVDWMSVAHNRDQWRALMNTVTNLRVP
jgi:hypothetical protein